MSNGAHPAGASGHHVQGYVLRRFLAQGGMAELFLARSTDPARSGEVVVVKRVLPQFVQDIQFARMFAREAALASLLSHPNIVEVFGSEGINEHECFFAMEYVHGPDLSGLLKQLKEHNIPVPLEHAVQIAIGMCAGLHHAHDKRGDDGNVLAIVHRDVSPSNVMLASDGGVKITDFGVAKALALTSFTQAGTRKGKLSYMSPEQAVADPVDRRTDIFAIGTVLYEMTTLQRMFGGENELAVMHKLLFRERPRPTAIRHDYPPELESIVMRAVAQQPADRFTTALEMQQALETFAQRRGLRPSKAGLAQWVATIIPPLPHPAQDPTFFTSDDPSGVIPIPLHGPGTFPGPETRADGYPQDVTVLDGSGPVPTPMAGQIMGQASAVPLSAPAAPSAPVRVHANPAAFTSGAAFASGARPRTGSQVRPRTAVNNSNRSGVFIIVGAVALAALIFGGALWYASVRDESSALSDAELASPEPESEGQPPEAAPTPSAVVGPRGDKPTPSEPVIADREATGSDAAAEPAKPEPPTPPAEASAKPNTSTTKSGRTKNKKRDVRKKKRADVPKTAPPKGPSTPPKTPPADPSTDKPAPTKKKKSPLDELFPSG